MNSGKTVKVKDRAKASRPDEDGSESWNPVNKGGKDYGDSKKSIEVSASDGAAMAAAVWGRLRLGGFAP